MPAGKTFNPERKTSTDDETKVQVHQLTNWKGHSNHFYFTTTSFLPGGKELVFVSDRDNQTNLFHLELATGWIRQLSDAGNVQVTCSCLNPVRREAYYFAGRDLMATDVDTLETRTLYHVPDGWNTAILTPSCDGELLAFAEIKDLGWRTGPQYQGFGEFFKAKPPSRIRVVRTDGSKDWIAIEEGCWISHVNFSPKHRDVICYCHEGPWAMVQQRMWICTTDGSKHYALRPQDDDDAVGHEYWLSDGDRVAFHNYRGRKSGGKVKHRFGWIYYDNSQHWEVPFPAGSSHFQSSPDARLVVGDGYARTLPYLLLWQIDGEPVGPFRLVRHDSSFHIQRAHCHPIFSPDGKAVLYTSDHTGYCNVYLAELPEQVESLPREGDEYKGF